MSTENGTNSKGFDLCVVEEPGMLDCPYRSFLPPRVAGPHL